MNETTELAPDLAISRVLTALWPSEGPEGGCTPSGHAPGTSDLVSRIEAEFTSFDLATGQVSADTITGLMRILETRHPKIQILSHWIPIAELPGKQAVRESVQRSLDLLQSECLDLLQYHARSYTDPAWLDHLFWLHELREDGMIRNLGLVDFDAPHLRMALASGIEIRTNQIAYSLLDRKAGTDMRDLCEQHGINILAYETLAGGFLTEKWLGKAAPEQKPPAGWTPEAYRRLVELAGGWPGLQALLNVLSQIAARHQVSIPVIANRYMLDQPGVAAIILNSESTGTDPVKEHAAILATELDRDDVLSIQQALNSLDDVPGGLVDTGRKHPILSLADQSNAHPVTIKPVYPVVKNDNGKTKVLSGAVWEEIAGYCRATRSGRRILVSGTTAVHGERLIGGEDPAAQTHFVIDKIQAAIESLGGRLEDVDRTRIYVKDIRDWEQVTRVHGERFGHIQPVTTLVQAKLIGEEYLVEIEAEARVV